MSKNLKYVFILIILVQLISCKKKSIIETKNAKLISEIIKNDIQYEYFSAKPKIKFDDGTSTFSSTSNLRIQKNKQIWLSVTPILGIEAMRGKLTLDSVFVLNRLQKEYSISSFQLLNQEFGIQMDYSILESLLLGDIPNLDLSKIKLLEKEKVFILTQLISNLEMKLTVDKALKRMTKLSIDDKKGNLMVANYSNFIDLNEQKFAESILLEITQTGKPAITAEIDYKRPKIEAEPLNFSFSIPSNYVEKNYAK